MTIPWKNFVARSRRTLAGWSMISQIAFALFALGVDGVINGAAGLAPRAVSVPVPADASPAATISYTADRNGYDEIDLADVGGGAIASPVVAGMPVVSVTARDSRGPVTVEPYDEGTLLHTGVGETPRRSLGRIRTIKDDQYTVQCQFGVPLVSPDGRDLRLEMRGDGDTRRVLADHALVWDGKALALFLTGAVLLAFDQRRSRRRRAAP